MLQINDDINDELFRRAAESYPLKTDSADWDAVLTKMNSVDSSDEPAVITKKRKNNYRFLLLLLLLIPLIIFENIKSPVNKNTFNQNNDRADVTTTPTKETSKTYEERTINNKTQALVQTTQPNQPGSFHPGNRLQTRSSSKNTHTLVSTPVEKTQTGKIKHVYPSGQRSKMNIYNSKPEADDQNLVDQALTKANKNKKKIKGTSAIVIKNGSQEKDDLVKKETTVADNNLVQPDDPETKMTAAGQDKKTNPVAETDSLKDSAKTTIAKPLPEKESKKAGAEENKKKRSTTKHFYAGLIIGPDFSTIKLQSVKKTGIGYGFLLGYRLTKKWSIEAGLLQDRKYYSTDGKYFNTKDLNYPPAVKIEYVTGVCKMLELPVSVSYTFNRKTRSGWFGALGFSSYFMQHESYVYDINYNGYRYPRAKEYDNKSTSILAMVNLSAGYTYKLGKLGSLRIEPYIKLPINKFGTGKLPIQSAGIYIGLTKDIF